MSRSVRRSPGILLLALGFLPLVPLWRGLFFRRFPGLRLAIGLPLGTALVASGDSVSQIFNKLGFYFSPGAV